MHNFVAVFVCLIVFVVLVLVCFWGVLWFVWGWVFLGGFGGGGCTGIVLLG